eukprot:Hpha_TRINITY_DN10097_c0_g1::TRINITY_DN10097_c0_g1_i3::g.83833::m.83833
MARSLSRAEGREIAEFVCSSCVAAIQDSSARVQKAALLEALPALAAAGGEAGWLCNFVASPVTDALRRSEPEGVPRLCAALGTIITALRAELLATVPPGLGSLSEGLDTLLQRAVERRIKGQWPAAEWLLQTFIPAVLCTIDAMHRSGEAEALAALVGLLGTVEQRLGGGLRAEVLRPAFEDLVL